jgi:hypothetical protein
LSGGFNSGVGSNQFSEHLDENDAAAAMGQKQLSQQQADPQQAAAAAQAQAQQQQAPGEAPKPRSIGSLPQELITRPLGDIAKGILSIFDINTLLGVNPQQDNPEKQAKKKQIHQRMQKLNQEDQEWVKQKYQMEMQKKKQEEQQKQEAEQRKRQEEANSIEMPSSPQKGPVGPSGSKKQKAVTKLNSDRQKLSGPSSAN